MGLVGSGRVINGSICFSLITENDELMIERGVGAVGCGMKKLWRWEWNENDIWKWNEISKWLIIDIEEKGEVWSQGCKEWRKYSNGYYRLS